MRKKSLSAFFIASLFCLVSLHAQPFTKKYIMAFLSCDSTCTGPQDHKVHLAESDDGTAWSAVPNFPVYNGSVPDPVIRGNKLYLYTPGKVRRYDNGTGTWDPAPSMVSIVDTAGNAVQFVDPSAIVDSSGNIVLFFLNSTGSTTDPAVCTSYPCVKHFDSAIEVPSSDGTQFVMVPGDRYSLTLNSGSASDPDIFFDGTQYILYISRGAQLEAAHSSSLQGTYTDFSSLPGGIISPQGGIGCGYYDALSAQYWTYTHTNLSGNTVIRQSVHSGFSSQISSYSTVVSAATIGQPASTTTESPGFCANTFPTFVEEYPQDILHGNFFPDPVSGISYLRLDRPVSNATLVISDVSGRIVKTAAFSGTEISLDCSMLQSGIYFYTLAAEDGSLRGKFLVN
ncbi:MAG TPA: T9SS type A sorting domain-containing protein [Bacteroidia bacterium]|nr:T9SS type A sorting domain-containing protein [Bacteroidia bacterium]